MLIIPGIHSVSTTMCLWINLHSGSRLIIKLLSRDIIYIMTVICKHWTYGDFYFSLCKARVYAWHCGEIFMVRSLPKALFISWQVNVKLQWLVWACNQKPCSFMALWGRCTGTRSVTTLFARSFGRRVFAYHYAVNHPHTNIILSWFSIPLVLKCAAKILKIGLQINI